MSNKIDVRRQQWIALIDKLDLAWNDCLKSSQLTSPVRVSTASLVVVYIAYKNRKRKEDEVQHRHSCHGSHV